MAGQLVIDPAAPSFEAGTASIAIEDVRRLDAPAVTLAVLRIDGIVHGQGAAERVGFTLDCPAPPVGQGWAARAALDRPAPGQFTTDRVHVGEEGEDIVLQLRWSPGDAR